MSRITPLHLRTLQAIERLGTFQAAADRLNTTQPAISARVREIEAQLGTALFRREGRRMTLTARGRQLVRESEPVLAELDRILVRAASKDVATGVVRVGTGEIAAANCLPAFVKRVQAAMPQLLLEIEVDLTARMLDHLLTGRSDLVFLAGPVAHPGIRTISLGLLDLVWLASPTVARGQGPHSIWSLPPHSPIHHIAREAITREGVACRSLHSCNNVRTMIEIIANDGGIGLLPEPMVRREIARGALVEVLARPADRIEFQAAIRAREHDFAILALFDQAEGLDIDPQRLAQVSR